MSEAALPTLLHPAACFDWMIGDWSFTRTVAGQADMQGAASVMLQPDGSALYAERARVVLATGAALHGEQRYVYRPSDCGFDILFCPSQALFERVCFHANAQGSLIAEAIHLCKEDVYSSAYRIDRDERLFVEHEVRGPRKGYAIRTIYQRNVRTL